MIKGVGVDIVEISRIKNAVKEFGNKFLNRVFTEKEILYCKSKGKLKFPELAVRFAAKEAYSKALGTGFKGVRPKNIEVVNNKQGKPHISISGKILNNVHISLSHCNAYALACCVIEENS